MKKTIKPIDLQVKTTTMDASGKYNWEKQVYEYDSCKFGTYASTYNGTSSSSSNIIRMILIPIVFLINLIVNEVNVYTFRSLRLSSILQ